MAYCLHELAKNHALQRRAHQEIDEVMKKFNGEITYDSMMDLKFLESCIDGKVTIYKATLRNKMIVCSVYRNSSKISNIACANTTVHHSVYNSRYQCSY